MGIATTTSDGLLHFDLTITKFFLASITLLAPLTAVKVYNVTFAEIFSLLSFGIIGAAVLHNRLHISGNHDVIRLLRLYSLFLTVVAALAIFALRLPTFPIPGTSILKHAPFLSLARLLQFIIVIGCFILTTNLLTARRSLIPLICQCYVYGGVISCVYGILSLIALHAGIHLGGVHIGGEFGQTHRIQGFFVEGGPFGVYLVSVILVCMFRRNVIHRGDPRAYWVQMILFVATLASAESKAGILLGMTVVLYFLFVTKRLRYAFWIAPLLIALALFAHLMTDLRGYASDYLNVTKLARENPYDPNIVEGRVMAAVLVPIMVAHHPIAGIGIGNYSLERNNPKFLGTLPPRPGLGSTWTGPPGLCRIAWDSSTDLSVLAPVAARENFPQNGCSTARDRACGIPNVCWHPGRTADIHIPMDCLCDCLRLLAKPACSRT